MFRAGRTSFAPSHLSLRFKLTLWTLAISIIFQIALALVVRWYNAQTLNDMRESRLTANADYLAEVIKQLGSDPTDQDMTRIAADRFRLSTYPRVIMTLYASDGVVLASNMRPAPAADEANLRRASSGTATVVHQPISALIEPGAPEGVPRVVLKRTRDGDGRERILLLAAMDVTYVSMLRANDHVMVLSVAVSVLGTALAAWVVAGLAISPLQEVRRLAESLTVAGIEGNIPHTSSSLSSQEIATLRVDLEAAHARLGNALQAQNRFISSVSHELKTPIAILLTEAQTIDASSLPPEGREFVRSVTDEMRRLARMIESFLMLTRVRGGMALANPKLYDVNDIVSDAVHRCGKIAQQYNVFLVPQLADHDPTPQTSGDIELLRAMFDNLIYNALRFSPSRERIIIRVVTHATECVVAVRDFGPGVPDEMKDKLFERFVQGPHESPRGRGHGLGLAIAQGIAELHGGRISVQNMPDAGCEFSVTLPLANKNAAVTKEHAHEPSQDVR